jgi:hypothetical protein
VEKKKNPIKFILEVFMVLYVGDAAEDTGDVSGPDILWQHFGIGTPHRVLRIG